MKKLLIVAYAPWAAIGTALGFAAAVLAIPVLAGWAHAEKKLLELLKDIKP